MNTHLKQIPLSIGYYIAGFTDGEGSFNVSFRPRGDYKDPWKVSLCFNVSQKDEVILAQFKRWLGCGTMRSRPDGIWYYEVNNLNAIRENIIPFFKRFGFLSAKKKRDFAKFCELADILLQGAPDRDRVEKILHIRHEMNDGGNRRYSNEEILGRFGQSRKSSETVRQDSRHESMIQSDLHGDMESELKSSPLSTESSNNNKRS